MNYLIEFIFASHKNQKTRAQPDWNVSPQKTQATIDKAESKIKKIDTHPKNGEISKITIEYSQIDFPENLTFPIEIPEGYRKITINELLQ